jgi:methionine biosynthesis protein MetW
MNADNITGTTVRPDHRIILDLIEENARVLDLGCGGGELLSLLKVQKNCRVTGIEINEEAIFKCLERGVTVSQGDIDSGLADYSDKRFDYVILNESLQEVLNPERVILEACRVGKKVIVGIPNFCNISARLQVFFLGRVPVTKWLPYKWYNTPNIRFLSLKDFRHFCRDKGIAILKERALNQDKEISIRTNLFAFVGIFLLTKD